MSKSEHILVLHIVLMMIVVVLIVLIWQRFHRTITAAEYAALRPGMDYQTVAEIIGDPGHEVAVFHNRRHGMDLVMRTVEWSNRDGSGARVVFGDDALVTSVAQGL